MWDICDRDDIAKHKVCYKILRSIKNNERKNMNSWKKQFGAVAVSQAFTLLGSAAVQFAVIWWLTIETGSAVTLALATIAAFVPNMLLGPFAGVWIDRYNRRTVMIAADILVAVSSTILGVAFFVAGSPPLWFVFMILTLRGLGMMFHTPAMQAAVPMLVPTEMLTKAGGWASMINSLASMLGPVLGATLMNLLPVAYVMLIDILGATFAIVCLLFVKIPDIPQSGEKVRLISDMKQGLAAMRKNKPLVALFPSNIAMNILLMPLMSLFPLLVRTHFAGTAWHNGAAEVLFAGGLLASSIIIGVWGGMKKRFLMAMLAIALAGIASTLSGLPGQSFWIFLICCLLMGGAGTFIQVPCMAYIQETIAPQMMGKVFALLMTAMTWSMPFGLLIAGPISESIGVSWWFVWSGIGLVTIAVAGRLMTRKHDAQTSLPGKTNEACELTE